MSKLKVNQIEPASGDSVTIPSGTKLKIDGTVEGTAITTAVADALTGYDDEEGGAESNVFYDYSYITTPRIWIDKVDAAEGHISAASNETPIVITTSDRHNASEAHGLDTDDIVTIKNVLGNTAANGTFSITKIDANRFSLQSTDDDSDIVGNGDYDPGVNPLTPQGDWEAITAGNHESLTTQEIGVGGADGSGSTAHVHSLHSHGHIVKHSSFLSTFTRKKYVAGVLMDVDYGCGTFYKYANGGDEASELATESGHFPASSPTEGGGNPWMFVGAFHTGTQAAVPAYTSEAQGFTPLADGTYPTLIGNILYGWVSPALNSSDGDAMGRWSYQPNVGWEYITGAKPRFSKTEQPGWYAWNEHLGWIWTSPQIFPYYYVYAGFSSDPTTPAGWIWWGLNSTDDKGRTSKIYFYAIQKWVDATSTINPPLNINTDATTAEQTIPGTTPEVNEPGVPSVIPTAQP